MKRRNQNRGTPCGTRKSSAFRLGVEIERYRYLCPYYRSVLKKNVEIGEIVGQGSCFYHRRSQESWIKVYVKEDKIGLIKLGQKARISFDVKG